MEKARVGLGLMAVAVVLALVALGMWNSESERVERENRVEGFRAAIAGEEQREVDADRTAPLATAGVASVLFVSGAVFVAGASSPSPDS